MADLDHFHDHCACTAEPVYEGPRAVDPVRDKAGLAEQLQLDEGEQLVATDGLVDTNGEQLYLVLTHDADADSLLRVGSMPEGLAEEWTGFDDATTVLGKGGIEDLRKALDEAIEAGVAHKKGFDEDSTDIDEWVYQGAVADLGINVEDIGDGEGNWLMGIETGSADGVGLRPSDARKLKRKLDELLG